jgi:hypothetical protein
MNELYEIIKEQKKIAIHNRDRNFRIIVVFIIMGFIFYLFWMYFISQDDPLKVIGIFFLVSMIAGIISPAIMFRKHRSKCPKCGMNWDMLASGKTIEEEWPICPGCGLDLILQEKL